MKVTLELNLSEKELEALVKDTRYLSQIDVVLSGTPISHIYQQINEELGKFAPPKYVLKERI